MTVEWSILNFPGYFSVVVERPQTKGGALAIGQIPAPGDRKWTLWRTEGACSWIAKGGRRLWENWCRASHGGSEQSRTQQPPACSSQNRAQHQAVSGLCALLGKLSGVPCVCGQLRVAVCQTSRSAPSLSPGLNDLCLPGADPWAQCGCRGTQPLPPGPALCIFQSQLDPMYHFLGLKGG